MPAHPSLFDGPEMDVLVAWCQRHDLDPIALFQTELHRMPTMWRDGKRAWWVVLLPGGQRQINTVGSGDAVRHWLEVGLPAGGQPLGEAALRMAQSDPIRNVERVPQIDQILYSGWASCPRPQPTIEQAVRRRAARRAR